MFDTSQGGLRLSTPSTADRKVAKSSRRHLIGQIVDPTGRVIHVESHLEFNWCLCLLARPESAEVHEQVAFDWRDADGVSRTHYFDFVVTQTDGCRIAYTVRPALLYRGSIVETMPRIATQAKARHVFNDVRLLTDDDLDRVDLFNAQLLHACRAPVPESDAVARKVAMGLSGLRTLGDLVAMTGLGGVGFRALVRLIRSGHLRLNRHECISYSAEIYKGKTI